MVVRSDHTSVFTTTAQLPWITIRKKNTSRRIFARFHLWAHMPFVRSLRWHHNGRDSVSNHQPRDCLLSRLFRRRSKKKLKLRVTGLCAGNSPGAGKFSTQMASSAENVSIWRRHHESKDPGARLNISSYQYSYSIYKDNTVFKPSYIYNGNPYTSKKAFLYWN